MSARVAAAAALLLAGLAAPAPVPPQAALIDALQRAMPLTRAKVMRLLPPPPRCPTKGCDYPGYPSHFGALPVGNVDVRGQPPSFVVVLSGIGGACTPVAALQRRYGAARVENGCTDGGTCMYAYAPRPWGRLFFSLPASGDTRACAREIILNSDRPVP